MPVSMDDMSHHQHGGSSTTDASALSSAEAANHATLDAVAHLNNASTIARGGEHDHDGASPSSALADQQQQVASVEANAIDTKKTGRPVHPLWAHFHRGEKRNRYHYHAFCIYCVARYGAEHVPPTRGVSIDMLRHIEKCANCPEKVVESLRDICGRRDAVRFDRYLKKKSESGEDSLQQHGDEAIEGADGDTVAAEDAHHGQQQHNNQVNEDYAHAEQIRQQQQQQQAEQQRNAERRHQQQQQQQFLHEQQQQLLRQQQQQAVDTEGRDGQQRSSHAVVNNSNNAHANLNQSSDPSNHANPDTPASVTALNQRAASTGTTGSRLLGKHALQASSYGDQGRQSSDSQHQHVLSGTVHLSTLTSSIKRVRTTTAGSDVEWKLKLLRTAVAAGLPFQAFENTEFQQLLRYLHPVAASGGAALSYSPSIPDVTNPKFLSEAANHLALIQLDRVKEGMHNSTIKGGLTLSINCWSTLDLQQLVAFTLVNSNGDASCVCVLDMGTQANAYSSTQLAVKIEDMLQKLESLRISVMGIVADSLIALNAARCVCFATKRKSLLVVPCLTRQLSILAGSLLTHELFSDAVGQMIEVASYFSNGVLQNKLRLVSGDDEAFIPLANRDNWYSFMECISAMLKYCDIVTAICTEDDSSSAGPGLGGPAPQRLKALVFADEGKLWKTLQELHTLLLPLKETYVLVFQHKLKGGLAPSSSSRAQDDKLSEENDFSVAAHGLTLAHIMYQLARMSQQYAGLVGTHDEPLAQMMQARINLTWQRYDVPVMVLAYVFNFHLDTTLLNMAHEAFQWESIATYFQEYFSAWFHRSGENEAATSIATRPSSTNLTNANGDSALNPVLGPITSDKVHEIFGAYKMNQFPFDADTTSDYVDVSSFYSFVSDSHPEICALCCRMYAISLLSANVTRIVRGIGYVPTTTQTVKSPEMVEFLLHVGFASSMKKVWPSQHHHQLESKSNNASTNPSKNPFMRLGTIMGGCHPDEVFWNEDVWDEFASDWRHFLELELSTEEFDTTMAHVHTGNSSSSRMSEMIHRKVPLDEVFVGTLAPLSTSGAPSSTTTTATNPSLDDTVLSMEM